MILAGASVLQSMLEAADGVDVARRPHRAGLLRALVVAGALVGVAAAPASGGNPSAAALAADTLRTATTGNNSEQVKTIAIAGGKRAPGAVVMSLTPGSLGELRDGDRLEATAEVEVSVCLKPNELHGSDRPCIGRTYGYDPTVVAELVLAGGGSTTGGAGAISLGKDKLTCAQTQPNRNHHCVLVIDDGAIEVDDVGELPCNAQTCHVNLVLSAHDDKAKAGDRLVVGSDAGGETVNGDKGRVNVTRYRPGDQRNQQPLLTEARRRATMPIAAEGAPVKDTVIYSVELDGLKAGEQLVIDARMVAKIGQHPYNVFQSTGIVLSEGPDSPSREGWPGRVGDLNGQIAEANGFNCTQGSSAHDDPCVARKVGVLEITRDSPKTLYVNLVAGMAAQLFGDRHRDGDTARILDEGFLRVYRYAADRNDAPPEIRD